MISLITNYLFTLINGSLPLVLHWTCTGHMRFDAHMHMQAPQLRVWKRRPLSLVRNSRMAGPPVKRVHTALDKIYAHLPLADWI